MRRVLLQLILVCLCGAGGVSIAAELVLYENDNFTGRQFRIDSTVPNPDISGLTFRASSVRVRTGSWQLCSDAYYRGQCVTLGPGDYPTLRAMNLNDRVHSVREFGGWPDGGGGGGGGMQIILYDDSNFGGRSYAINGNVTNLDGTGFNDRAQSAIVNQGQWELCADANFGGGCQVFGPGRYANLGPLANRVSSVRSAGGQGGAGGGGWGSGSRVVLYEGPNLSGRTFVITSDTIRNLDGTGFNDRASSLRVERGYWLFCTDAQFQGECRTFGPGDYPTLPNGLNNAISSGRRISNDYPYNQPPNWGRP